MSDGVRLLTVACTLENAVFILFGYYYILYVRMYVKDGSQIKTNSWLWAGIGRNFLTSCTSGVFVFAAFVAFLVLFKGICDGRDWAMDVEWFVLPYILLLFFSSLYSFLLLKVFKAAAIPNAPTTFTKLAVLADLFCVAAAACVMAGSIWNKNSDGWAMAASLILAFNCTVFDFMFWGFTFFMHPTDGIHHTTNTLIFSTAVSTDCIRIRHTDVIRSGNA